ncbi:MAG: hypothetical protein VCE43_03755 [Myxococcota bacterium]
MNETASKPAETATDSVRPSALDRHWGAVCFLAVFPLTAILHNSVFFPATCILNAFGQWGDDYTSLQLLRMWLLRDPALWIGFLLAHVAYHAGIRRPVWRLLLAAFLVAFLPLTVWIWDIPFTDRVICYSMHDGRLRFGAFTLSSKHVYFACSALYGVLLLAMRGRIRAAWARA